MKVPQSIHFNSLLCKIIVIALVNVSISLSVLQGKDLPYMTSDVNEVSGKYFDYIVVGGGTSGCAVAATLSEKFSVLLVERGGSPYGNPLVHAKNNGLQLVYTDEHSSIVQNFVSEDGVSNARGRVLGGSSTINLGFYSRASDEFICDAGWDAELVKEAYEWVESKIVYKYDNLSKYATDMSLGLVEAGFLPFNGFTWEHIVGTKVGASIFDQDGERHSAADLLMAGNAENIVVLLSATVKNIILQKNGDEIIAQGIRFIKSDGSTDQTYEAYIKQSHYSSRGDVILSAGTLGSPQILLLSGIGPKKHLEKHNIPVVLNLEGVGREMQDNPAILLTADSKQGDLTVELPQVAGISQNFKFIVQGCKLFLTSPNKTTRIALMKIVMPESRGKLELINIDPRQNPSVEFNYLKQGKDLEECVNLVRLLNKLSSSWSLSGLLGSQPTHISVSNTEEVKNYCKQNVGTYYHFHGGCNVGRVIDANYRVLGVEGLRVIDASTFYSTPGTNPMATLLMLGRYQGVKILKERSECRTENVEGEDSENGFCLL